MLLFLSKFLPLLIYPLGLGCLLLLLALILRRYRTWQTWLLVLTLAVLWLGGNRIVTMVVTESLERQYLPPQSLPAQSVVVVLGGGTRAQVSPRATPEINEAGDRLLYAVWLYRQGNAAHILLSGGNAPFSGSTQTPPEAEVMATLMETMDVPRTALWLESKSRNTEENAVESRKILEQQGIKQIILVTSAMHMPRAVRLFQQQGLQVIPAPTDFLVTDDDWTYYMSPDIGVQLMNLLPSADDLALTSRAVKELIGAFYYRLRGWQ